MKRIHIFHKWTPYKLVGSEDTCIVEICKECFKTRKVGHNFQRPVTKQHFDCMDSDISEEICIVCGGYYWTQTYGFGSFGADHGFSDGTFFTEKIQ